MSDDIDLAEATERLSIEVARLRSTLIRAGLWLVVTLSLYGLLQWWLATGGRA